MLWCQGAQNIGLSTEDLNMRQSAPHYQNARPSQTDGRTSKVARRFVLRTHRALKTAALDLNMTADF